MIGAGALGPPIVGYLLDSGVTYDAVFVATGLVMLAAGAVFPFLRPPQPPVCVREEDAAHAAAEAAAAAGATPVRA